MCYYSAKSVYNIFIINIDLTFSVCSYFLLVVQYCLSKLQNLPQIFVCKFCFVAGPHLNVLTILLLSETNLSYFNDIV